MPMQIRGTVTPNNPPAGLAERQLSVEMGSSPPKLWCGVPTAVDASGRVQVSPPTDYISNSALTAALADYLPIVGGALSAPGNLTASRLLIGRTLIGAVTQAAGGLMLCDAASVNSVAYNSYYTGTAWNYLAAGTAARVGYNAAQSYLYINVFPSGAANATISELPQDTVITLWNAVVASRTANLVAVNGNINNATGVGTGAALSDAVIGTNSSYVATAQSALALNAYYTSAANWKFVTGGNAAVWQIGGGGLWLYTTAAAGTTGAVATMNQRLAFDNAGNAAFGANLSSSGNLTVSGANVLPAITNVTSLGNTTNRWAQTVTSNLQVWDGITNVTLFHSGGLFRINRDGADIAMLDGVPLWYWVAGVRPNVDNAIDNGVGGRAWRQVAGYLWGQQSDPRQKKDITDSPGGALAKVMAVKVKNFHWKSEDQDDPVHIGFLTTDVKAAFGADSTVVVIGTDQDKTEALNSHEMTATLWQAVQELTEELRGS